MYYIEISSNKSLPAREYIAFKFLTRAGARKFKQISNYGEMNAHFQLICLLLSLSLISRIIKYGKIRAFNVLYNMLVGEMAFNIANLSKFVIFR